MTDLEKLRADLEAVQKTFNLSIQGPFATPTNRGGKVMATHPPNQLMCIECGATRSRFDLPIGEEYSGLVLLFELALGVHALSGLNSSIPETRAYWQARLTQHNPPVNKTEKS